MVLTTSKTTLIKAVLTQLFLHAAGDQSSPLAAFGPILSSYNMTGFGEEPVTELPVPEPVANHSSSIYELKNGGIDLTPLALSCLVAISAIGLLSCLGITIHQCRRDQRMRRARQAAQGQGVHADTMQPHVGNRNSDCGELAAEAETRSRSIEMWRAEASADRDALTPIPQQDVSTEVVDSQEEDRPGV
jgi:hypothetical protein